MNALKTIQLIPLGPIMWAPAFLTRSAMRPEHLIELIVFIFIAGLAVGYGCRGLWSRILHKLRGPVFNYLTEAKNRVDQLVASAETDAAKVKAEAQKISAYIEKVLS